MFKQKNKFLNPTPLSSTLEELSQKTVDGKTSINDLFKNFHENGIVLAMIIFSLPIAIPLPYPPGFTTLVGTPLIILSYQMLLGYDTVHFPKKVNEYEIKNSTLIMVSKKVIPHLKVIENYIKPRLKFATSVYCEQLIGFVSLISSIAIALPLPLTNAIPALGITVLALGLLNRDGIVIIIGFIISFVGLFIAVGAVIASWIGIKYLFKLIF